MKSYQEKFIILIKYAFKSDSECLLNYCCQRQVAANLLSPNGDRVIKYDCKENHDLRHQSFLVLFLMSCSRKTEQGQGQRYGQGQGGRSKERARRQGRWSLGKGISELASFGEQGKVKTVNCFQSFCCF